MYSQRNVSARSGARGVARTLPPRKGMDSTDWTETVRYIHTALWIANVLIYSYAARLWTHPERPRTVSDAAPRNSVMPRTRQPAVVLSLPQLDDQAAGNDQSAA
jgi:hypothetical protein